MRVAAVGWLAATEAEALDLAAAQAAVSHDHPDAIAAAQAVALAILLIRQVARPAAVRERLSRDFGYDLRPEVALRRRGFDVSAAGTVPPALTAPFEAADSEGAVRAAVCLGAMRIRSPASPAPWPKLFTACRPRRRGGRGRG
jgi:ADP-ribosyl-[dinitrogen reductase] hydrolase